MRNKLYIVVINSNTTIIIIIITACLNACTVELVGLYALHDVM